MTFTETDIDQIAGHTGRVAVTVGADGKLNPSARRINKLTKGALERLVASDSFTKLSAGDAVSLGFPTGMAAEAVDVVQRRAALRRLAPESIGLCSVAAGV